MKKYNCTEKDCIFSTNNKKELTNHIKLHNNRSNNLKINDNNTEIQNNNDTLNNKSQDIQLENKCDCGKKYKKYITLVNHKKNCIIHKILIDEIDLSDPKSSYYIEQLKKHKSKSKNKNKENVIINYTENKEYDDNKYDDNKYENNESENNKYEYNHDDDTETNLVSNMVNNIINSNPSIIMDPYNLTVTNDDIEIEKAVIYKIDKDKFINELSKTISRHIYDQLSKIIDDHNSTIIKKYNKILEKYNIESYITH